MLLAFKGSCENSQKHFIKQVEREQGRRKDNEKCGKWRDGYEVFTFVGDILDIEGVLVLLGMWWITPRREEQRGVMGEREEGIRRRVEGRDTKTARVEGEVSQKVCSHGCVPKRLLLLLCCEITKQF